MAYRVLALALLLVAFSSGEIHDATENLPNAGDSVELPSESTAAPEAHASPDGKGAEKVNEKGAATEEEAPGTTINEVNKEAAAATEEEAAATTTTNQVNEKAAATEEEAAATTTNNEVLAVALSAAAGLGDTWDADSQGSCVRVSYVPEYSDSSASSVAGNDAIGYRHGLGKLDSTQAWSAGTNAAGQYWQMDLGSAQTVGGVVTQGRGAHNQYVKSYKVEVSLDGSSWSDVDGGQIFTANSAASDDKVENLFASPVSARFLRIVPQTWNAHISMRSGVLLCACPTCKVLVSVPGTNTCLSGTAVSQDGCLAAVQSVIPSGEGPTDDGRTTLITGSWTHVPPGCSVHSSFKLNSAGTPEKSGDWAAHYNTNPSGSNNGDYSVICNASGSPRDVYWATVRARWLRSWRMTTKTPDVVECPAHNKTDSSVWTSEGGWADCLACPNDSTLVVTNPGINSGWCNGYQGPCKDNCETCITEEGGWAVVTCTTCPEGSAMWPYSWTGGVFGVGQCRAMPVEVHMRTLPNTPQIPNPKGVGYLDACTSACEDDRYIQSGEWSSPVRNGIPLHLANVVLCTKACREQTQPLNVNGTQYLAECNLEKWSKLQRCENGTAVATGAQCGAANFIGTNSKTVRCATVYEEENYGMNKGTFTHGSLEGCEAAGADNGFRAQLGCGAGVDATTCASLLCSRKAGMF